MVVVVERLEGLRLDRVFVVILLAVVVPLVSGDSIGMVEVGVVLAVVLTVLVVLAVSVVSG